ncbi:MAG: hypothetical protein HKO95_04560 [Rhodobacteraceae bacterium]|nr:hypothetical protein [Alphaproteobacteria bacterium]MBT8474088.1 hypothetical protein [Alphaproteobacteria bacterium]NNK65989.1 hypothetical protein [Paracoccaceae bacterium]
MGQRARTAKELDPKGVIQDSYLIEGISEPECRSIFLDWAIGVPMGEDARDMIRELLALHGDAAPDHPMTQVLRAGLGDPARTGRRGGRRARLTD